MTPDDLRRNANGSVQPEHDLLVWAADEIERLRAALDPTRLRQIIATRWQNSPSEDGLVDETVAAIVNEQKAGSEKGGG